MYYLQPVQYVKNKYSIKYYYAIYYVIIHLLYSGINFFSWLLYFLFKSRKIFQLSQTNNIILYLKYFKKIIFKIIMYCWHLVK